ncbi:MAG: hypothetical protein MUO53_05430 [Maribacter sp.]|nr:hypothetical protein [Maribacter sp.]
MRQFTVCIASLLMVCGCRPDSRETRMNEEIEVKSVKIEQQEPLFEDLKGHPVALSDFKGK